MSKRRKALAILLAIVMIFGIGETGATKEVKASEVETMTEELVDAEEKQEVKEPSIEVMGNPCLLEFIDVWDTEDEVQVSVVLSSNKYNNEVIEQVCLCFAGEDDELEISAFSEPNENEYEYAGSCEKAMGSNGSYTLEKITLYGAFDEYGECKELTSYYESEWGDIIYECDKTFEIDIDSEAPVVTGIQCLNNYVLPGGIVEYIVTATDASNIGGMYIELIMGSGDNEKTIYSNCENPIALGGNRYKCSFRIESSEALGTYRLSTFGIQDDSLRKNWRYYDYNATSKKFVADEGESSFVSSYNCDINVVNQIPVTGISISGASNKIAAGKKVQLKVNIKPANAGNKGVVWKSSNPRVATVNASGLVTINKKAGGKSVVITATAKDGKGASASYKIYAMKGIVKKITISGKKVAIAGKSLKLKAKVTATKKANKKLAWTSSNPKYATVSASGNVKTYKAGKGKKVKITAKATDGSGKKKTVVIKIK